MLKHIKYVYIKLFVMCLAILVHNWWLLLVGDLYDDKHDGVDGSISMRVETLEADLFEHSVQRSR